MDWPATAVVLRQRRIRVKMRKGLQSDPVADQVEYKNDRAAPKCNMPFPSDTLNEARRNWSRESIRPKAAVGLARDTPLERYSVGANRQSARAK